MKAIIRTGGKQYRVAQGDILNVEKLPVEAGDAISFSEVLLVEDGDSVQIGAPLVSGVEVSAKVVGQIKEDKVVIMKYRRRTRRSKKTGHRQPKTRVEITAIGAKAVAAKKPAAAKKPVAKKEEK